MKEGKIGKRKEKKERYRRGEERYRREGGRKRGKQGVRRKGCTTPSPQDAFPSQELGNNMTPIKGRLGKNTTPTQRDPETLIQRC